MMKKRFSLEHGKAAFAEVAPNGQRIAHWLRILAQAVSQNLGGKLAGLGASQQRLLQSY